MSEKGKGVSSTPSLNITESKQAEEELARLSQAVRMSADSIVISDMEGKITYVNEATLKMYGTDDPKDLLGKSSFELIAPEDREKAFAGMKEVMERGYAKDREYHVTTKSGSKILTEMSTSLVKSKTGEAVGFVGITRDITERKQMEEALRESEMKYKLLFESSGSAITYFDAEGKCVFLNRRGAKYLGGEAEEFIGKSIYDIFPETANFYVQRFSKIMNEGKGYIFEDSVELPDGKRWFSSNIQPVKDESGTVRGIQIISDDITERKRAEQALADEATRRRILVDQSRDGIVVLDENGKVYEASKRFAEMLGYTPEEVRELHVWDWDTQWSREQLLEMVRSVDEAGDHFETYHRRKDGTTIDVEISTNGAVCAGQKLVFCVCRDITERKQAEEALRLFSHSVESSVDGMAMGDLNGKITYVNEAFVRMSGYSKEELIGKEIAVIYPDDQIPKLKEAIKATMEGSWTGELIGKRKDGELFPIAVSSSRVVDDKGNVIAVMANHRDITERKRAEEALRQSESRYRNLFELSPLATVTLDMKGMITSCNAATPTFTGFSEDEMVGKHFTKLPFLRARDMPRYMKIFSSLVRRKVPEPFEIIYDHRDGNPHQVKLHVGLLKEGGRKAGVQVVCEDITERKQMEKKIQDKNQQLEIQNEELRAVNEELRASEEELHASNEELRATNEELRDAQEKLVRSERLAAIGQLAGGVGHELRNPLSAIKNAVYYVRGKVAKSELGQKEPQVIEFLDIMDDEINSSSKIINDLLGFSRVGKPTVSPTRIERVIDDALSYTTIPENIELTKKLDTDLPEVKIDTNQVRQVLVNMILNAVQAMPTGGKLTISAREKDKFLEVEITDTGCGIPQEVMDKIFNPLFTTRAKGIGLGLAVCKAIIDRHQGHIEVESEIGEKTTFTVKLPLEAEQ